MRATDHPNIIKLNIGSLPKQFNNNKNNNYFNGFPLYNNDFIADEMRHEYIEKKKEKI